MLIELILKFSPYSENILNQTEKYFDWEYFESEWKKLKSFSDSIQDNDHLGGDVW